MNHYLRIQEIIYDYFDKTDNQTLIDIIDTFSYELPVRDNSISKIIEKFLDENGLTRPFLNREIDKQKKIDGAYFLRSSMSDVEIMNNVSMSLISLAYNRFRQIKEIIPPKLIKPVSIKILETSEIEKGTHIVNILGSDYTLCGQYIGEWEVTNNEVNCKQCLSVVDYCKHLEI